MGACEETPIPLPHLAIAKYPPVSTPPSPHGSIEYRPTSPRHRSPWPVASYPRGHRKRLSPSRRHTWSRISWYKFPTSKPTCRLLQSSLRVLSSFETVFLPPPFAGILIFQFANGLAYPCQDQDPTP